MKRLLFISTILFLLNEWVYAQERELSGRVMDMRNEPIPNASIVIMGTQSGTKTDNTGNFRIRVSPDSKMLEVTAIGYQLKRVAISNNSSMIVVLEDDSENLQDVVVTGFKNERKDRFAGATTKITDREFKDLPVSSFDQVFQGKVPGALVLTTSGQPGQSANIRIRGTGSINGGSAPLFIIDGIQVEESVFQSYNPNDFESFDVHSDAIGSAMYGSRGSGGVIVATTKRGRAGTNTVNVSTQWGGKQRPDFGFTPMNSRELLQAQEQYGNIVRPTGAAVANNLPGWHYSKLNPRYQTATDAERMQIDRVFDSLSNINTDWLDEFTRAGTFNNNQVSFSGGSGKTRYFSSLGYYTEQGTTPRNNMRRATARNNIDFATERFTMSISSNIGYTKRSFPQSLTSNSLANPFLALAVTPTYVLPYKADGSFNSGGLNASAGPNLLESTHYDRNYNDQIKITLSVNSKYRLTNDISIGLTSGIDFRESQNTNYGSPLIYGRRILNNDPSSASFNKNSTGFHTESISRYLIATLRPYIEYNKTIADKHELDVSLFGEYIPEFAKGFGYTGYGTDPKRPNTPGAVQNGNQDNKLFSELTGNKSTASVISAFALANYTYDNRYSFNFSARRDGSSKLAVGRKFHNFFAGGFVWNILNEKFMENTQLLNALRFKVSYGSAGNHNNFPSAFGFLATYVEGNYAGIPTINVSSAGNANLTWEEISTFNTGLDFSMFNNRLSGEVNFYNRVTHELFVSRELSPESGPFTSISVNAGKLRNRGVEMSFSYDLVRSKDLLINLYANASYNKNEVIDLGGLNSYPSGTSLITVGLPLGSHFEVEWAGVDQSNGRPLYYTKDGKLTSNYSTDDKVQKFGTWESPWKGGFGTNISYKDLSMRVLFSWQSGGTKVDNLEYFVENPVGFLGVGFNQSKDLVFWQNPGDIVNTPSPLYSTNFSSKIIHSTDFMRLRELAISYNVKNSLFKSQKWIKNASLSAQCMNLFIWTPWKGLDPEAGAVNINVGEYPNPRSLTMGLSIDF